VSISLKNAVKWSWLPRRAKHQSSLLLSSGEEKRRLMTVLGQDWKYLSFLISAFDAPHCAITDQPWARRRLLSLSFCFRAVARLSAISGQTTWHRNKREVRKSVIIYWFILNISYSFDIKISHACTTAQKFRIIKILVSVFERSVLFSPRLHFNYQCKNKLHCEISLNVRDVF